MPIKCRELALFVAFSHKGSKLAVAERQGWLSMWDISTQKRLWTQQLSGQDSIEHIAFSHDDSKLALALLNRYVEIRQAEDGDWITTLVGHEGWVRSVAFTPDDREILSGSTDNTVRMWDSAGGEGVYGLIEHEEPIGAVAFNSDGNLLATGAKGGGPNQIVRLWDGLSGVPIAELGTHPERIEALSFDPGGQYLVSAGHYCSVIVWDLISLSRRRTLKATGDKVGAIRISPDGRHVVVSANRGETDLFDIESGELITSVKVNRSLDDCVWFGAQGAVLLLVTQGSPNQLWDLNTHTRIFSFDEMEGDYHLCAMAPNGNTFILQDGERDTRLLDMTDYQSHFLGEHACEHIRFSLDSRRLMFLNKDASAIIFTLDDQPKVLSVPADNESDSFDFVIYAGFSPKAELASICTLKKKRLFHIDDAELRNFTTLPTDLSAFSTSMDESPFLPVHIGKNLMVLDRKQQKDIGMLALDFDRVKVNPAHPTHFAGINGRHLYLFSVEGSSKVNDE